jgi:inner membrane protein
MDTIEKIKSGLFDTLGFKLAIIGILSLLLLIPTVMIMQLIREREQRRDETIQSVTANWGNAQTLSGPVLTLSRKTTEKTGLNEFRTVIRYAHFLPEDLEVTGTIEPEIRYRGIYQVVTYRTRLHVAGRFLPPDPSAMQIQSEENTDQTYWIEIGLSDMRGINQNITLQWGDVSLAVVPGIPSRQISKSGVHAQVPAEFKTPIRFAFDLDLNGSQSLNFIPLGKETRINLSSSWNSPSFGGAFLPDERKISDSGFSASWKILQLNRNYPQQWTEDQYTVEEASFGVDLKTPVDMYQKSVRSVKYAILFIGLTFLIFFFAEVMTRNPIHPVNYLLVGAALVIFYSLLFALSEYVIFGLAYLTASILIISMISLFTHALYRNKRVTLTVSLVLTSLYLFLYVILQLEDYSLLFGNLGLVIILGLVMYFSRKIDWYSSLKSRN